MSSSTLHGQLENIAKSSARCRLLRSLARVWLINAAGVLAVFLLTQTLHFQIPGVLYIAAAAALFSGWRVYKSHQRAPASIRAGAEEVEADYPNVNHLIATAADQVPDAKTGVWTFLQNRLLRRAESHSQSHDWNLGPEHKLFYARCYHAVGVTALLVSLGTLVNRSPSPTNSLRVGPGIHISPGDVEIERGSSLVVSIRFPGKPPLGATLVITKPDGKVDRLAMLRSMSDPLFGLAIPSVETDLRYRIEYNAAKTPDFNAHVFEYPALARANATLTFPEFTKLPKREISDTRRITAVEGTDLSYRMELNKPVNSARLLSTNAPPITLKFEAGQSNVVTFSTNLLQSASYHLELVDAAKRTNQTRSEFVFQVMPNKVATLKLLAPQGDQRPSPVEELRIKGEAVDDYGLVDYGVAFTFAGGETEYLSLGTNAASNEKKTFEYLLDLEARKAVPNNLVSYFVWADDLGNDGKPRRAASELYFAEVRPFEEIFRESQNSPSQQGSGEGQDRGGEEDAGDLAELQRQVVLAAWNVYRSSSASSKGLAKRDVTTVKEGQQKVQETAEEQAGEQEDPKRSEILKEAIKLMAKAADQFEKSESSSSRNDLLSGINTAQAASQALQKLSEREFNVSQSSSSRSSRSSRNASMQRQLSQMEFRQEQNRYEKETEASAPSEQTERIETLNRLRQLAQRQQDLNERLKEIEAALQEAKTGEERDELKRQLKRLREEQEQMLAELDDVNQRMSKAQDQASMKESRQQLEETRENMRASAQAMEEQSVSKALAAGARAQRELQELKEDFRKQTSSQFADEMRDMRRDARQLAERQATIADQLKELETPGKKSLADTKERHEIAQQLESQRAALTNLVQRVQQVSEQSETAEPILSKRLYEAWRQANQANVENQLSTTSQLTRQGFVPQAMEPEKNARRTINELKQQVESAAEGVLGSELESLQFAERELQELTDKLGKEIAAANPAATNAVSTPGAGMPNQADLNSTNLARARQLAQGNNTNSPPTQIASNQGQQSSNGNSTPSPEGQGSQRQSPSQDRAQGQGQGQQPGEQGQGQAPGESQAQGQSQAQAQAQGQGQGQSQGESQSQSQSQAQGQGQGQAQARDPGQGQPQGRGQGRGGAQAQNQSPGQQPGTLASEQGQRQPGQSRPGSGQGQGQGQPSQNRQGGRNAPSSSEELASLLSQLTGGGGGAGGRDGPITGENFGEWADRLRNVEDLVDDPALRDQLTQARERATLMRSEYRRLGSAPKWSMVSMEIQRPLVEVQKWLQEELNRKKNPEKLTPIDRDQVPRQYSDLVRKYYERLSSGK